VRLFLDVIEYFSRGNDRAGLLDEILGLVASRFEADSAAFYCFFNMNSRSWPSSTIIDCLEPDVREGLLERKGFFYCGESIVPVIAMDSVRGALGLRWNSCNEMAIHEQEVLLALGRQLGIALENLEAMENILKQKAILESVFEGIADPLFLLDGVGRVVQANESGQRLLKDLILDCPTKNRLSGLTNLAAETEAAGNAVQIEIVLADARSFIFRAYPLRGYGGTGRTIVYGRDNTNEKTMLARLQQGEKSLALGKLVAGLAHEINNPLGVILCYARLLWDDGKSEHAQDINIIIRHCLHAQMVLQDLMRFARPKPVATGPVRLVEAVEFIARVFEVRAAKHNIKIAFEINPGLPPLLGNANAIEQILTNIVINSMDALEDSNSDEPGHIMIRGYVKEESGEVVLSIADNGPGIPTEYLSRVFDPFFTTKEVGKGTGLGLAVVYGLVRDLGGRMEVENRQGAIFTIFFRVSED
jgi:signal transduction histidine kinase